MSKTVRYRVVKAKEINTDIYYDVEGLKGKDGKDAKIEDVIKDDVIATDSTYSSSKIEEEIDAELSGKLTMELGTELEHYTFVEDKDLAPISEDVTKIKANLSELDSNFTILKSINLFDYNNCIWGVDGYFGTTGKFNVATGYKTTTPIFLTKGNYLYCTKQSSYGASYRYIFKCDETGETGIVPILGNDIGLSYANDNIVSVNIVEDGFYRFNCGNSTTSQRFMIVKGSVVDDFPMSFNQYYPPLKAITVADTNNPLLFKKITVNGDSICYGAGYSGGYAKIISENNYMVVQNIAISGGVMCSNVRTSSGELRHCISTTVENMAIDSDYAILEGGVNDASLNLPLGEITSDYQSALNTETFYGAVEFALKTLTTRFKGKKYGFILVHQMTNKFRLFSSNENDFAKAIVKCCQKWGVPYLDLNTTVPPFGLLLGDLKVQLTDVYTANGDGWHPNEEGYKKYYVPKIESWLKTL